MKEKKAANIFWTGGWDSTFRVLQLIIVKKKSVRPHYILDPKRKSALMELSAIKAIRSAVFARYPYTRDLLGDLIVEDLNNIGKDKKLLNSFVEIAKRYNIGWQYSWLASYCIDNGIEDMEISTQKPGENHDYIIKKVELIEEFNDSFFIYKNKKDETGMDSLFHLYRFPILEYTKLDMQAEATMHNFGDILELSWFCHAPKLNNKPCGTCTPCILVMEQGLRRRVSLIGYLRYFLIVKTGLKKLKSRILKSKSRGG